MSNISQVPFYTLAGLGLIDGVQGAPLVVGRGVVATTTFEDVSDFGDIAFPTAAESWELNTDDGNDTSAGTGARTVFVETYDADSNIQAGQLVTMNGGTVALTGTHYRLRSMTVVSSGTTKGSNIGTVTLRVASAGATRAQILPGNGVPFNSFYHVPAGKVAVILQTAAWTAKGEDAVTRSMNFNGDSTASNQSTNVGGPVPIYQNSIVFPILAGTIPEKIDFWTQANTEGTSANVTTVSQIVEFDEDSFDIGMASILLTTL